MVKLSVKDMNCGGCVKKITEALEANDPTVEVEVDLEAGTVEVDSSMEIAEIKEAIEEAGFPAEPVA